MRLDDECFYDGHVPALLDRLQGCVAEHFPISIEHSTFQFEQSSHLAHEATRHHSDHRLRRLRGRRSIKIAGEPVASRSLLTTNDVIVRMAKRRS